MRNRLLLPGLLVAAIIAITLGAWPRARRAGAGPSAEEVSLDPGDPTAHWPARYRGNPLLLVTEAYVLDTIGELPPRMQQLVPELVRKSFKKTGDWKTIVRGEIGWKEDVDQTIRAGWEKYQAAAKGVGQPADPLDFAQQFADAVDKAMEGGSDTKSATPRRDAR